MAISPPRLSFCAFLPIVSAEEFRRQFAVAEELVAAGRGDELLAVKVPLPYFVCAAGFIDRYGPAERYNVLKLLDRVKCPTLVTMVRARCKPTRRFEA